MENIFIAHPVTDEQVNALKAMGRALKVKFEIRQQEDKEDQIIINNLKKGFEEMQLIKKGKLKTTSLKKFLDEL